MLANGNIAISPAGSGFSCIGPGIGENGTITCTNASMANGDSVTFTITVQAEADMAGGVRTNTATVSSSTADPTPGNNTDSEPVTVTNNASLSITKTGPVTLHAGDICTYEIAVTNSGSSSGVNVNVTDTLPANTTFLAVIGTNDFADACAHNGGVPGVITCSAGFVSTGTHLVDITVQLAPDAIIGSLSNSATLAAAVGTITGASPATTTATIVGGLTIYGDQDVTNQDNVFLIRRHAGIPTQLDIFLSSVLVFSGPIASVPQINIFGLGGNDQLIVDSTNGLISVPDGIRYNGGDGFDSLTLTQTGGPAHISSTDDIGPGIGSGQHTIVGGIGTQTVFFEEIDIEDARALSRRADAEAVIVATAGPIPVFVDGGDLIVVGNALGQTIDVDATAGTVVVDDAVPAVAPDEGGLSFVNTGFGHRRGPAAGRHAVRLRPRGKRHVQRRLPVPRRSRPLRSGIALAISRSRAVGSPAFTQMA